MSKNPFMSMGTLGWGLGFALNGAAFQPTINYDTLR